MTDVLPLAGLSPSGSSPSGLHVLAGASGRLAPLQDLADGELKIHEIYSSIQGESTFAGLPCTFVRTTACNLRCTYCDTAMAFQHGAVFTVDEILLKVSEIGIKLVEVTGGEPLLQPAVLPLMSALCDLGYQVLLETSGSLDISNVDSRVVKVIDFKTPSSGEVESNLLQNIEYLSPQDEIKFVIGGEEDFLWAHQFIAQHQLKKRCAILMGTVFGKMNPATLVELVLHHKSPVRVQLQMHKYIWDPKTQGV